MRENEYMPSAETLDLLEFIDGISGRFHDALEDAETREDLRARLDRWRRSDALPGAPKITDAERTKIGRAVAELRRADSRAQMASLDAAYETAAAVRGIVGAAPKISEELNRFYRNVRAAEAREVTFAAEQVPDASTLEVMPDAELRRRRDFAADAAAQHSTAYGDAAAALASLTIDADAVRHAVDILERAQTAHDGATKQSAAAAAAYAAELERREGIAQTFNAESVDELRMRVEKLERLARVNG